MLPTRSPTDRRAKVETKFVQQCMCKSIAVVANYSERSIGDSRTHVIAGNCGEHADNLVACIWSGIGRANLLIAGETRIGGIRFACAQTLSRWIHSAT